MSCFISFNGNIEIVTVPLHLQQDLLLHALKGYFSWDGSHIMTEKLIGFSFFLTGVIMSHILFSM